MTRRWRPPLWLVLGGALAGTLVLSFLGLVVLRYLGPEIGFREAAAAVALVIALLTAGLGALLVRLLLRPIHALRGFAAEVRAAPQTPPDPPAHYGTQELHATALSVIDMAETLRARESAIRGYSDHVTHELKTPVAGIRAAVELMEDGGTLDAESAALLSQIDSAAREIEAQLDALRRAARAREPRHRGQTTLAIMRPRLTALSAGLRLELAGADVPLPMAADGLEMLLAQLLGNAASHGARSVHLMARAGPREVALEVADDGPGISPGHAARVFEPFFTTRRGTGGTGMGLTIARNLAEAHGGRLHLLDQDEDSRGARFLLTLPGD